MLRSRDNKRRGSQLIAHKQPCPILSSCKRAERWSRAWLTEYLNKVATIADHRMWNQFNKEHMVYRCTGPIRQPAKILDTWVPCFSFSVITLALSTRFHNLRTTTGSNFDRCAPRMRYDTSQQAQHSWRSFPPPCLCDFLESWFPAKPAVLLFFVARWMT